jgi:hypothetical protein
MLCNDNGDCIFQICEIVDKDAMFEVIYYQFLMTGLRFLEFIKTAEHPFLPGTHVAEANDAKPFYNQPNFNEGKGGNGGGHIGRNDSRNGGGKGGHNRNQGQNRSQGSGQRRGFNRNQERDRNQGSDRNRESQPRDPETRTEPANPPGPPKPFTRFKPRE